MFCCVSYYLGAFGTVWIPYETRCKTGRTSAKVRATKSRRIFFRNERIGSTPLDPKLTFWCVLYYLGAFGTVWVPYETRCKTGRSSAEVRATKSHRNFSHAPEIPHRNLNSRFGAFRTIWVHSGPFGCLTKLGQNGRTCAKVRATKSRWNFSQRTHRIHPIGP